MRSGLLRPGKAATAQTSPDDRHCVDQLQSAGLLRAMAKCSAARAYEGSARSVGVIDHGTPYDVGKIELTVAVCIRTGKLEETPRRWIQLMRLGCRRVSRGPFKPELQPKLLNAREGRTQCKRGCAATPQPIATALCCGRFVGVESHDESPAMGSIS